MRVFISADIEGIATTTVWSQAEIGQPGYEAAREQMTREVAAACEGAHAAGADYILVKDAHNSGTNLLPEKLPRYVELERGWSGSPFSMATGVDHGKMSLTASAGEAFDAAMFVGYHSAAGREGNPLSHTFSGKSVWVKLNGVKCSEFRLYSYAAAMAGVPSVLLTGDRMLCDDSADIHPKCLTVAVKDGYGGMTRSLHPDVAVERIRAAAEEACRQNLSKALISLPERFVFEICYKLQTDAAKLGMYPGFVKLDDNTIRMETSDFTDVLRAVCFVL